MQLRKHIIESKDEADSYLKDLLDKKEYQNIDEVKRRAKNIIEDGVLKEYFINKGKEILENKKK